MVMIEGVKLDRIDIKILSALQENGRITTAELAERVGLSSSPCHMRVKKLQKAGYILGYSAQVDIARLGGALTVFTEFTLKNHRQIDIARFQEAMKGTSACVECYLVTGGYDYLAKFVTSSVTEYQEIMEDLMEREVGIDKYYSFVVMKAAFIKRGVPLLDLFGIDG